MSQDSERRGVKDRFRASYDADRVEVRNWINGNGKMAIGAIALLLGAWLLVSFVSSLLG